MAEDPSAIREAIEETRAEMADTIDALGQKADVKGRAANKAVETTERIRAKAAELGQHTEEAIPDQARPAVRSTVEQAGTLMTAARRRPAVIAVIGVAILIAFAGRRRARRSGS
jgi:hypothetical protein